MRAAVASLLLSLVFPLAALCVQASPGAAVNDREAAGVVGAVCYYQLTTTHLACDPNDSHSICVWTSWGNTATWDLQSTNQLASSLYYPNCPCSSGVTYARGGGTCTPGYYAISQ